MNQAGYKLMMILYNTLILSYIAKLYLGITDQWNHYFAILSILTIIISFFKTEKIYGLIAGAFLSIGFYILWVSSYPLKNLLDFFGSTIGILALLSVAPLFSIPINLGAYHRTSEIIFRNRLHKPIHVYFLLTTMTMILGSLMSVAAIATAHATFHHLTRSFVSEITKKINTSYSRGTALALVWSPVGATIGIAISGTQANPVTVIGISLVFALLMLFLDSIVVHFNTLKKYQPPLTEGVTHPSLNISKKRWVSAFIMLFVIFSFIVTTLLVSRFFHVNIIDAVVMLIIPYSIIWGLFLNKPKKLLHQVNERFVKGMTGLSSQFLLFISVGFLTQVMIQVGHIEILSEMLSKWNQTLGPFIIVLIVLIVIILPSLSSQLGLFPALTVALLVEIIPFQVLGLRPEWFAVALVTGAIAGVPSSPLTVNVNILSIVLRESAVSIAKRNVDFLISMLFVSILFLLVGFYLFPL